MKTKPFSTSFPGSLSFSSLVDTGGKGEKEREPGNEVEPFLFPKTSNFISIVSEIRLMDWFDPKAQEEIIRLQIWNRIFTRKLL